MKQVYQIKHVRSENTQEKGTLYLSSYRPDKKIQGNECFQSIVVHFAPEGEKPKYIKSFILNKKEEKALREALVTTMRDIGFILTVQNSYLDIICLEGCPTDSYEIDPNYKKEAIRRAIFRLDLPEELWAKGRLVNEYRDNDECCGIRLALIKCLENPIYTTGSITPCDLPTAYGIETIDYLV